MALPRKIIQEDRRLDKAQSSAAEALMKLRWHWTLDASNSDRVSLREYAKQVGRSFSTVSGSARGYELLSDRGAAITPAQARELANMGTETAAATEAVAEARGIGTTQARKSRPVETRRVREMARQRAEDNQTSVEEEAPKVAAWIVKQERAEKRSQSQRAQRSSLRFVEMEGKLAKAKGALVDALRVSQDVSFSDEERDLLLGTIENIKALLGLMDMRLAGAADVDWDTELAKLVSD